MKSSAKNISLTPLDDLFTTEEAQRMKKLSQVGALNEDTMLNIMSEQKKPELSSNITLSGEQLRKYFPKSYTPAQIENTIWIGSTLKKFHGIQKRVEIPSRATAIMSEAFTGGLPIEQVTIPAGVTAIQFASFDKCSSLKEARIEGRNVKIEDAGTIGAFLHCPQVVVYCYRDSMTHDELKRTHQGEIRFIDEGDCFVINPEK